MTKLYYTAKPYIVLLFIVLLSTFIAWLPFLFRVSPWFGLRIDNPDMGYIYRQFDGLLYVVVAKTAYVPEAIRNLGLEIVLPERYFAAHLPLYPLLIRIFSVMFGYIKSMIVVNILATIFLAWFFYFVLVRLSITKHPLLLSIVFLFLARFVVVRVVGAPESLFMLLVLVSLYSFEKKQYLLAGVAGFCAVLVKSPGMLLFGAYGLTIIESWWKNRRISLEWAWLALIPAAFGVLCLIYAKQYGDFFAYFHSGDNIHLVFPFSAFNFREVWVGTAWLEDIIFYFFLYGYAVIRLFKSPYRSFFYFSLVFFIAVINVQHRDIARYSLPIWPLACIAFEQFFTSRKFLLIALILLPAIMLYTWNMLSFNVMPVSNWKPFL